MGSKGLVVAQMESEIAALLRRHYGRDLVAALVEGSYASDEFVPGQSDYDLIVFVRNFDAGRKSADVSSLITKYGIEIKPAIKSYEDFKNRIRDNDRAKRFVTNLSLIYYKKASRLFVGKDVRREIPSIEALLKRDLSSDLREQYYHMTNAHPAWNVALKKPDEWLHGMVNLAYGLLLSKGVTAKKKDFPRLIRRLHPAFTGVPYLKISLALRESGRILRMSATEKRTLKKAYGDFLEAYRTYLFFG